MDKHLWKMLDIRGVVLQEYSSDHNDHYKSHEVPCKGRTFTVLSLKVTCYMNKSRDFESILGKFFSNYHVPWDKLPNRRPSVHFLSHTCQLFIILKKLYYFSYILKTKCIHLHIFEPLRYNTMLEYHLMPWTNMCNMVHS